MDGRRTATSSMVLAITRYIKKHTHATPSPSCSPYFLTALVQKFWKEGILTCFGLLYLLWFHLPTLTQPMIVSPKNRNRVRPSPIGARETSANILQKTLLSLHRKHGGGFFLPCFLPFQALCISSSPSKQSS
ncbi:hypothetical protein MRB53_016064 [Persea americana]|uniref:Uncharacterized protein n=1 Tax=Persea americana TaxID=3435 RepID=A0ACC2M133_PERAE|nr:hypothetical protein MRB53_016064 [Persea americana]